MNLTKLLAQLTAANIRIWTEQGQLKFAAPPGAMTDDIKHQLRSNKAELISLLEQQTPLVDTKQEQEQEQHREQDKENAPALDIDSGQLSLTQLSFAQQRLLFMVDAFEMTTAYNMPSLYRIQGSLDLARLQQSVQQLVATHPALRTGFVKQLGEFKAQINDDANNEASKNVESLKIDHIDLRSEPAGQRAHLCKQVLNQNIDQVFNLANAPLMRVTCIQLADNDYRLLLDTHHVISDGWSHGILWRQLWQSYLSNSDLLKRDGGETGETAAIPESTHYTYQHYVAWQQQWLQSNDYQRQQQFWQDYLHNAPQLSTLPLDKPRPQQVSYAGAVEPFTLSANLTQSLTQYAHNKRSSLYILLLSALYFTAFKYNHQHDMCIGTSVANRRRGEWESVVGFFANVVALRQQLEPSASLAGLIEQIRDNVLNTFEYQDFPFEQVVKHLQVERSLSHAPLFQMMLILAIDEGMPEVEGLQFANEVVDTGLSKFDLTLTLKPAGKGNSEGLIGGIEYSTAIFEQATMAQFARHFIATLEQIVANDQQSLAALSVLSEAERQQMLYECNQTQVNYDQQQCVHELVLAQAKATPNAIALIDKHQSLTYGQLHANVLQMQHKLQKHDITAQQRVGISCQRSVNMVCAMLAVMACGCAYVPVDVNFPQERQQIIIEEADLAALICDEIPENKAPENKEPENQTSSTITRFSIASLLQGEAGSGSSVENASIKNESISSDSLAYLIFTSGSTGRPKGVMLTHRNVHNLFVGLDDALASELQQPQSQRCFRALTSISFDISVLELFWTLSRGFRVIVEQDHFTALQKHASQQRQAHLQHQSGSQQAVLSPRAAKLDFSFFYFASDESHLDDKYQLLKEGATFADQHGFSAVWVPERHFHSFGGQFPNPAVAGAAVAALTENIEIRSGSVVLPLHHPMRVAEEWSMVDNLSHGRAALSIASGWHFNDFSLAPENFEQRHQIMRDNITTLKKLWAGEAINCTNGKGEQVRNRIYPSPVRKELPIWITAAANPDTFRYAGEIGANVLTHLLGQSLNELADKIALYRQAREENGFDPAAGKVTLMLHSYLADDEATAMKAVEKPFKDYLRNSLNLLLPVAREQGLNSDEELEVVVEAGFQRYARNSALFGTPQSVLPLVEQVAQTDIDEIACLIDFGVAPDDVLAGFTHLNTLRDKVQSAGQTEQPDQTESAMVSGEHIATHMQCTPSYARLLYESSAMRDHLSNLQTLLVGGEALSPELAKQLNQALKGNLYNMYGPTETTVWSAVGVLKHDQNHIGRPLANTQLYVLDDQLNPVPYGVEGMLYIGGDGVAKGYWKREQQTAEAFVANPFVNDPNARMYKTGDLVRRLADQRIVFVGRKDNQVKIRGHRVELEEIVTAMERLPQVAKAACIIRDIQPGNSVILAYLVPDTLSDTDEQKGLTHEGLTQQGLTQEIVAALKQQLPEYMIPAHVFELSEMPYTPNGKLDTKALPVDLSALQETGASKSNASNKIVPPANDAEATIVGIWRELLNLTDIGTQDSFFELGGHSLLLGQMQAKLQTAFGVELDIIDLFKYPTIASLAQFINTIRSSSHAVTQPGEPSSRPAQRENRRAAAAQTRQQMKQRNRRGR